MSKSDLPADVVRQREKVGARIRALRTAQQISQERLAEQAGVSRQTVYRAELATHAISVDSAALLAAALGAETWQLFLDAMPDAGGTAS